jgi:hypothetical protein
MQVYLWKKMHQEKNISAAVDDAPSSKKNLCVSKFIFYAPDNLSG